MFRKSVLKNRGILSGGKKAVTAGRAAVTQMSSFSTTHVSPFKADGPKSDSVQDAIRIMNEGNNVSGIADELLTNKLNDFEKLIIEAKLSIGDCMDASNTDEDLLDEDRESAKDAVREAMDVFSDINHSFQQSFEDGKKEHSEVIKNMASQLDELKNDLESVLEKTRHSDFVAGLNNIMNRIMYWRN